jgi:signal transduction histidine kinase
VFTSCDCHTRLRVSETPPTYVYLYRCFAGLWEIAAPIHVGDNYLGTMYAGQILIGDPTQEHLRHIVKLAVRLGQDTGKMLAAFLRVHRLSSKDQLASVACLLARTANQIAHIGMERLRSLKQMEMLVRLPTSDAVKTVAAMLDTESCAVFLKTGRRRTPVTYVLEEAHGLPASLRGRAAYAHGVGAVGICAERGISFRPTPAQCKGKYARFLPSGHLRNLAASPIRVFGDVLGVIVVANKRGFPHMTMLDEKTLESAANQISRNMEHEILQRDTEAARVFLAKIVQQRDLTKLRGIITRGLPRLVDADACTLFLRPSEFLSKTQIGHIPEDVRGNFFIAAKSKPVYISSRGDSQGPVFHDAQASLQHQAAFSYAVGEGLTGWVGYGVPIFTTSRRRADLRRLFVTQLKMDLARLYASWWGRGWRSEFRGRFGIAFSSLKGPAWRHKASEHKPTEQNAPYAAVPLLRGDEVIGVIRLSGIRSGSVKSHFTATDAALLSSCANQLILALNSSKYVDTTVEAIVQLIPHQLRGYPQRIYQTLGHLTEDYRDHKDWRLEACYEQSRSLLATCDALIRYLNVEGGKGLHFTKESLAEMIEEAWSVLRSEAEQKKVDIALPDRQLASVSIRVDRTLVVHALWNLLRNAVSHARANTRITCRICDRNGDTTRVSVRNVSKVPFIEHSWDKLAADRTGLRLVKKIVHWHGGFVSCRPVGGKRGVAEFSVDFP